MVLKMNVQLEEVETEYRQASLGDLDQSDLFYFDQTPMMVTNRIIGCDVQYLVVSLDSGKICELACSTLVTVVEQLEPLLFSLAKKCP